MDYGQIIHRTVDDSYVITKNGMPYHIPNAGEYAEEWITVHAYAKAHPEYVTDEGPTATDYLVMPDYPLDTAKLEEIKAYRQALRDLPQQLGFPWGGPQDPECPWPVMPVLNR